MVYNKSPMAKCENQQRSGRERLGWGGNPNEKQWEGWNGGDGSVTLLRRVDKGKGSGEHEATTLSPLSTTTVNVYTISTFSSRLDEVGE